MKALTRLQATTIVQAATLDDVAKAMNQRARQFITLGALLAATMGAAPQTANAEVLSTTNCAAVGAVVGAAAGVSTTKSDAGRLVAGALLGLGGAAAGEWLCSPSPKRTASLQPDAVTSRAATYGMNPDFRPDPSRQRMALSLSERERLDALQSEALTDKYQWKKALVAVHEARESGNRAAFNSASQSERNAYQAFKESRDAFASTVSQMYNGVGGMAPRAVSRYLEVSGALLELEGDRATTYQVLEARDMKLKELNPRYAAEADRNFRNRMGS